MNVNICSREEIESLVSSKVFPENTVIISFYDPEYTEVADNHIPLDSLKANFVFSVCLEDVDLCDLDDEGISYEDFFPEVDDLAQFIYTAYTNGLDIICQCEYGESRSAGCAAAILEHFYHTGITVFTDYKYYPNRVVYHKVFDALEQISKTQE